MIKKLIKHGNSSALILDKSLLKLLNADHDTPLKIQINGNSLIITPMQQEMNIKKISENEAVQRAFENVLHTYGPALKKLADN